MPSVVFLVQRIGPYHHARMSAFAAANTGSVTVVEFRANDTVYAWQAVDAGGGYSRRTARSRTELRTVLRDAGPDVVVCTGYADPEVHQAVSWALAKQVPLVTCSDSTRDDEPRSWAKEAFKRRVVRAFDAALVAGHRAAEYLRSLGMKGDCCFLPWDVVDNAHFAHGADEARLQAEVIREGMRLPGNYFLCVARFVRKKNLEALIDAYARYARQAEGNAWSLVLSGSGELEAALRARAGSLGVADRIKFPGFVQYDELPAFYGLAHAFVLPSWSDQWGLVVNEAMASGLPVVVSSRCGCVPELVAEGENGFTFDPSDEDALGTVLARMAGLGSRTREEMGRRSRAIVASYSPQAFAAGLGAAVNCAMARRRKPYGQGPTRLLFSLLAARNRGPA